MVSISMGQSKHTSILDTIIAANYDEYTEQRGQLREVFETDPGFAHLRRSPTPPPPRRPPPDDSVPPPPPPPLPSGDSSPPQPPTDNKMSKSQRKSIALQERSSRFKRLRPDIPRTIPQFLTNERALTLGGYRSQSEMDKDLLARERGLSSEISS